MSNKTALRIVQKYHPNVTKLVDAKRPLQVQVTARDCKSSTSKAPDSCAMAKACEREFDGAIISTAVAYIISGDKAVRYMVPQAVAREIVSFDRNHAFSPGEYQLKAPTKCQTLQARRFPKSVVTKTYSRNKRRVHKTEGIRSL